MDSLLVNYASSEEEEEQEEQKLTQSPWRNQAKQVEELRREQEGLRSKAAPKSAGIFSSLPPPKSTNASSSFLSSPPTSKIHSSDASNPLPNPFSSITVITEEDDEEDDGRIFEDSNSTSSIGGKQLSSFTVRSARPLTETSVLPPPQPKSSSIWSSLPLPKTQKSDPFQLSKLSPSADSIPKRIVQFRPPIDTSLMKSDNDDYDYDEDDEKDKKLKKERESSARNSDVSSFKLGLPKPKNSVTLGVLPSASGSGRRSILEADVPTTESNISSTKNEVNVHTETGGSAEYETSASNPSHWDPSGQGYAHYANYGSNDPSNLQPSAESYVNYDGYGNNYDNAGGDPSTWGSGTENYTNYYNHGAYSNYSGYGHYESNQVDRQGEVMVQPMLGVTESENVARISGKRGRNEIPQEIVEVKQDELMKNRPREDQVKLTGIAFGPSYQPVSTKGKPSKLHKRKHQIGSLYFDMKQKEMELAERRAKGFLTKAETQAKYGW